MSKIGKKTILLPKDSSIDINGSQLTVKGPKGTKVLKIGGDVNLTEYKLVNEGPFSFFCKKPA